MTTQGGEAACSVLGLDISSFALHGCLLVPGQAPVLRMETLGTDKEPLIERLRRVTPNAIARLGLLPSPGPPPKWNWTRQLHPDWIVIEDAYGPSGKARKALDLTAGAIIASCPSESQVALVRCADWRSALSAKNTKLAGHEAVLDLVSDDHLSLVTHPNGHVSFNEHELDALGIALAWQRILSANVLGATP